MIGHTSCRGVCVDHKAVRASFCVHIYSSQFISASNHRTRCHVCKSQQPSPVLSSWVQLNAHLHSLHDNATVCLNVCNHSLAPSVVKPRQILTPDLEVNIRRQSRRSKISAANNQCCRFGGARIRMLLKYHGGRCCHFSFVDPMSDFDT